MKQIKLPSVPYDLDPRLRIFLQEVKNAIESTSPDTEPLDTVTNLRVTPIAGGNKIQFTKSNGEAYTLYIGTTQDITQAYAQGIGSQSEYDHIVAAAAVTRYYWVVTNATNKKDSLPAGPISGTTLALNTPVVIPTPPPMYDPGRRRPDTYIDEVR